jgi:hypothetical protein
VKPSPVCYPQPGKAKALEVCRAFAAGCGGQVVAETPERLLPGPAVFYGVRPAWRHLWAQARSEGRAVYYIDNGFFAPGQFYRVARGAVQAAQCRPDHDRLRALGIRPKPMRRGGATIVVALQSDEFLATFGGRYDTAQAVVNFARAIKPLPLVIRRKDSPAPLLADLTRAAVLVTLSSNAAVMALLEGVEAVTLGESACTQLAGDSVEARLEWAARLAASQWTLDEMATGKAWRDLHDAA